MQAVPAHNKKDFPPASSLPLPAKDTPGKDPATGEKTMIRYGVWNGIKYDNRAGGDAAPEGLDLKAIKNFNPGNPIDVIIGNAGFLVFDESVSLAGVLLRYYEKVTQASCGRCTPCRTGSRLIELALRDLVEGRGDKVDWDHIYESAEQMMLTSLCGIGRTAPAAFVGAMKYFRQRLLSCPKPMRGDMFTTITAKCIEACPAHVNVPRYIDYVRDGHPELAAGVLLNHYPLVATCGRVCVRPCELACRRNEVDQPIAIRDIKRWVSDNTGVPIHELFKGMKPTVDRSKARVAVVGAGPAGLNCAYHLLLMGYPVDIYDKDTKAGGMALRGIPPYRLPKGLLAQETEAITELGGVWHYGKRLGKDFTVSSLFEEGYAAVFLGIGCAEGAYLGLPGEDRSLNGYQNGIDFLLDVETKLSEGQTPKLEGDVVVVGCGNVAMDCCRSARRITNGKVHVVYRRTRNEASADQEEIDAALDEGVEFHFLTNPVAITGDNGRVTGVRLTKMELTEKDARGRRGVRPIEGSEFDLPCATVIAAIGQKVERNVFTEADGVLLSRWGTISVTPALATTRPGVFAGGDCATGPTTLIGGLSQGEKAATSIDEYLSRGSVGFTPRARMGEIIRDCKLLEDVEPVTPVRTAERQKAPHISVESREKNFCEVDQTFTVEQARAEAARCMRCYRIYSVVTPRPIPGNYNNKPAGGIVF